MQNQKKSNDMKYYEVTVCFKTIDDNGKTKKHNDIYLVDAASIDHVEELMKKELSTSLEEWEITKIQKSRVAWVVVQN